MQGSSFCAPSPTNVGTSRGVTTSDAVGMTGAAPARRETAPWDVLT